MRPRSLVIIVLVAVLSALSWWGLGRWRRKEVACRQRQSALVARDDEIRRGAHDALKIGTPKQDVIRFFAEHKIPFEFGQYTSGVYFARGHIATSGCAPFGCLRDDVIIVVDVRVDAAGTVLEKPSVVGAFTGCP